MIKSHETICMMNGYKVMTLSKYCCDLCEADCYPDSSDPKDWLYRYDGEELCFECFIDASGTHIVKE